jgi:hypothetical protein
MAKLHLAMLAGANLPRWEARCAGVDPLIWCSLRLIPVFACSLAAAVG